MGDQEFNVSILETIRSSDSEKLAIDFTEIAFDQLTELEGLAKEAPRYSEWVMV